MTNSVELQHEATTHSEYLPDLNVPKVVLLANSTYYEFTDVEIQIRPLRK